MNQNQLAPVGVSASRASLVVMTYRYSLALPLPSDFVIIVTLLPYRFVVHTPLLTVIMIPGGPNTLKVGRHLFCVTANESNHNDIFRGLFITLITQMLIQGAA